MRSLRVSGSNHARSGRCASRYGAQLRTWVNESVGFRFVNGVLKSGRASFAPLYMRSGYRNSGREHSYSANNLGFR